MTGSTSPVVGSTMTAPGVGRRGAARIAEQQQADHGRGRSPPGRAALAIETVPHGRPPRIIVAAASASRNSNAIRLHVSSRSATAATSADDTKPPLSLSDSRIATAGRPRLPTYTSPRWTCRPVVVSSLSRPTNRKSGRSRRRAPRATRAEGMAQVAVQTAVLGVHVAADPDREAVVEAGVAARLRAPHQEPGVAVAEDRIRDDLLPGGSASIAERGWKAPSASDQVAKIRLGRPNGFRARPRHRRARSTTDAVGTTRTSSSLTAGRLLPVAAIRVRRGPVAGRDKPRSNGAGSIGARRRARGRRRRGRRLGLEQPQPVVEDRLEIAQPVGDRRRRWSPGSRRPSPGCPRPGASSRPIRRRPGTPPPASRRRRRHGLDQGRRDQEWQVAHGRDRRVVLPARRAEGTRRDRLQRGPRREPPPRDRPARTPTMTHGRSREQVRVGRPVAVRLPAGHRMAADEAQPASPRPLDDRGLRARDIRDDRVGGEVGREGPARSSSSSRQACGGAASTIRSAPRIASAAVAEAADPIGFRRPGPRPSGVQAVMARRLARDWRRRARWSRRSGRGRGRRCAPSRVCQPDGRRCYPRRGSQAADGGETGPEERT